MAGPPAAYTHPKYGSEGGFRSERNQRKKGLNREFAIIVEPSNGVKRDIRIEAHGSLQTLFRAFQSY